MLQKFVEEIKTLILRSLTFFFDNRAMYGIMRKNVAELVHATDDNIVMPS